jgi:hypothetical protein
MRVVDGRLYVGFAHAACLLLQPQCPSDNQAQSDAQRSQLIDMVATGKLGGPIPHTASTECTVSTASSRGCREGSPDGSLPRKKIRLPEASSQRGHLLAHKLHTPDQHAIRDTIWVVAGEGHA